MNKILRFAQFSCNKIIVYKQIFKGHQGAITTMSTDAQGRILYTASADATIRSWNINQGQLLKVYHYFYST